jgi:hypothetical protein
LVGVIDLQSVPCSSMACSSSLLRGCDIGSTAWEERPYLEAEVEMQRRRPAP